MWSVDLSALPISIHIQANVDLQLGGEVASMLCRANQASHMQRSVWLKSDPIAQSNRTPMRFLDAIGLVASAGICDQSRN